MNTENERKMANGDLKWRGLLRVRSLLLVTLPMAVLLMQPVTLRWDWRGRCPSYGFPLPYINWAGSSLEWNVAPFFLAIDLVVYAAIALGLQYIWLRWICRRRKLNLIMAGLVSVPGYATIAITVLFWFSVGRRPLVMEVFETDLDTVVVHAGTLEYCPNER